MLDGILKPAAEQEKETLRLHSSGCAATSMKSGCGGQINTPIAKLAHAQREVQILHVNKKTFIITAQLFEHRSSNQHKGANDLVNLSGFQMVPFRHLVSRENKWQDTV